MISDIKDIYQQLSAQLQQLNTMLIAENPDHYVPLRDSEQALGLTPLQWTGELLSDLIYQDGRDGRETRSRHGLILATPPTQTLIGEINASKDQFATAVRTLREESESLWKETSGLLASKALPFRDSLTQTGLSRLHLRQCTRHIHLLDAMPLKCGFSWYNHGRSITRISVSQAEEMLLALGEDKTHIQVQLSKLHLLSAATPLARVQTQAPVVRANLVFADSRRAMNCALPLFLPAEHAHQGLPDIKDIPLDPPEGRTRKMREDDRISEAPFLPSIRVHTYR